MLEKTMKQIINKKVNKWLDTIDDKKVKKIIKNNLIITGGCFTSMIQNEAPNDFDCYFKTKEAVLAVANYYVDKWNEAKGLQENSIGYKTKVMVLDGANPSDEILSYFGKAPGSTGAVLVDNCPPERVKLIYPSDGVTGDPKTVRAEEELGADVDLIIEELDETKAEEIEKLETKPNFPVFISSNAITLSGGIQLVVRFYGEPNEIHDTYDFEHTKAYWTSWNNEIIIPKEVYECVVNKTLKYSGSKYPVCSVFRLRKFIARGWRINAGQLLKMAMQISELNLQDINVLEDQLVGVDSLYFMHLIHVFRAQKEKDSNFNLDATYVMSLVDKVF